MIRCVTVHMCLWVCCACVCMCVCVHVCARLCMCVCIYVYMDRFGISYGLVFSFLISPAILLLLHFLSISLQGDIHSF